MEAGNDDQNLGGGDHLDGSDLAERGEVDDLGSSNKSNARLEVKATKALVAPNTRRNTRVNAPQIPGKYPGNARQIPGARSSNFDALDTQIPDQMPEVETLSGLEQFDQSTGWEDLWRIEKDGETRYRWRLRFAADRRGRPGGKITPAIRRKLKKRPGKGRHGDSRKAAERFRRRAEFIAERLRAGDQRRFARPGNTTNGGNGRPNTRADDPTLEREQMPRLRELDNWPDMPDVLM